jgi:hypothetical protein
VVVAEELEVIQSEIIWKYMGYLYPDSKGKPKAEI